MKYFVDIWFVRPALWNKWKLIFLVKFSNYNRCFTHPSIADIFEQTSNFRVFVAPFLFLSNFFNSFLFFLWPDWDNFVWILFGHSYTNGPDENKPKCPSARFSAYSVFFFWTVTVVYPWFWEISSGLVYGLFDWCRNIRECGFIKSHQTESPHFKWFTQIKLFHFYRSLLLSSMKYKSRK